MAMLDLPISHGPTLVDGLCQCRTARHVRRYRCYGRQVTVRMWCWDRGGNEWTVINPHGAFKGQKAPDEEIQALKRRRVPLARRLPLLT